MAQERTGKNNYVVTVNVQSNLYELSYFETLKEAWLFHQEHPYGNIAKIIFYVDMIEID